MNEQPLRVAAIDIGSNAIKIRVVEAVGSLKRVIGEQRWPIRLGESTFEQGALSPRAIDDCVNAFHEMAQMCRGLRVEHVRAVATSATREAANSRDLLSAVFQETGIEIEVISGSEEARILALGMKPDLNPGCHNLIIDVGGGSTEIIYINRDGTVDSAHSIRLGAVRLALIAKSRDGRYGRETIELLEENIESLLERSHLPAIAKDTHVVGVAGTIRALNDAIHHGEAHPATSFSARDLRQLIKRSRGLSADEMERRLGVEPRRANILVPGALVVLGILDLYSIDYITISDLGLRDGIIEELLHSRGAAAVAPENTDQAAMRVCEKYRSDTAHGQQVAQLALSLFDQLQPYHELSAFWREILKMAAICHDIGQYISYSKHHKHGHYLLMNEEFPGVSPRQQSLIACLVRYHRKNTPQPQHPEFVNLSAEDQQGVRLCAPLLRLADGLDRQHHQVISGVRVLADPTAIHMEIYARAPANLELAAALKNADFFAQSYQLPLEMSLTQNE